MEPRRKRDTTTALNADIIHPLHLTVDLSSHQGARMARSSTQISSSPFPPPSHRTSVAYQGDSSSPALSDDVEPMRLVSRDRSSISPIPLIPLDLDIAEVSDAPPRFFLATPAEVFEAKEVSAVGTNQRERTLKSETARQEPSETTEIDQDPTTGYEYNRVWMFPVAQGGNADENVDDMIDEEVAMASARATRRGHGGSTLVAKFKLRPKPSREEDCWALDHFFRD